MRREVVLLQGPVGPFFARFADDLEARGFTVTKINLNGGDRFFYRRSGAIDYTGTLDDWEVWLDRLLINREVGRIYLFGDCRAYHRIAREVARRRRVRLFVFEEGYVRPNFVTLEEHGVNGHSPMMTCPIPLEPSEEALEEEIAHPGHVFSITALYAMLYYWAAAATYRRFSHYRHHRPVGCVSEGMRWLRSGLRKWRHAWRERHAATTLEAEFAGNYFVCPLQVHCDTQVVVHSDFNSIEHFIGEVLASFRERAPANTAIVFKHHPLDRGYSDYTTLLDNLAARLGLHGRVFYAHDLCLPTLLRGAQGTVLINSTVGLSSLFHGTPVKTLGKAIYDREGLTFGGSLDAFWSVEGRVDAERFKAFRDNLVARNQLNGSFYRRVGGPSASGLLWSERLEREHTFDAENEPAAAPRLVVIDGGRAVGDGAADRDGKFDDDTKAA